MTRKMLTAVALTCALAMALAALAGCGGTTPTITAIAPKTGAGGTLIAVTGTGFGSKQGSSKLMFANTIASVRSWTDTAIAAAVPSELKAGPVKVTVDVGGKVSGSVTFTVTASGSAQKQGEIEHNTPVQAMTAYLTSKGLPTTGITFVVDATSKTDPNWKIDASYTTGSQTVNYWLLHNVSGTWKVVAYGTNWDPKKLGAPADLKIITITPPAPTPPAKPHTEADAIQTYLASKGKPTDNWQLSLLKASTVDPNWEVIHGVRNGVADNFLLVWNNMAGAWEVLADGGPPWTGVEFKGAPVPSDLAK